MVRGAPTFMLSRRFLRLGNLILIGIVLSFTIGFCVFKFSEDSTCHMNVYVGTNHTENDNSVVGALNIHVWRGLCGSRLSNLRQPFVFSSIPR